MKSLNLKKLAAVSVFGMAAIVGTSDVANAQGNGRWKNDEKQERKIDRQQEKIRLQRARIEQERLRAEQLRILAEQRRQAELNRRNTRYGNDRSNGNGYYNGNANANRYRVNRNGTYYNTDQRGAELLRQAVNSGYQQGFQAGRNDLSNRRRVSYSNSNIYQSGTYGYQSYVNQSQYQYYFRQGFQRGYQDGSNSRYQNGNDYGQYNNQQYQYGSSNNGVVSILGTILGQILNIQPY